MQIIFLCSDPVRVTQFGLLNNLDSEEEIKKSFLEINIWPFSLAGPKNRNDSIIGWTRNDRYKKSYSIDTIFGNHWMKRNCCYIYSIFNKEGIFGLNDMVSELSYYWIGLFEPVVSGPTSYRCTLIFRPCLAEGPNIYHQKRFFDFLFSVKIIS